MAQITIRIITLILIIGICFSISMLIRNNLVFNERVRIGDWIFSKENWYEILLEYRQGASYNEMMYKFWKPVKSFHKDLIKKYD